MEIAEAIGVTDQRLDELQSQVNVWADGDDFATVRASSGRVLALVTGIGSPRVGGAGAGGTETGALSQGLLPGEDGTASIAEALENCAGPDLFGGSWENPAERWATFDEVFARWSPTDNTFPTLPSHAQRIVGWAMLAAESDDLDDALTYASHAQIHVDAVRDAVRVCAA